MCCFNRVLQMKMQSISSWCFSWYVIDQNCAVTVRFYARLRRPLVDQRSIPVCSKQTRDSRMAPIYPQIWFFLMQVCHQRPPPEAVMLKDSEMLSTGPSHMTSFHACMWRYLIHSDVSRLVSLLTCDVELKTPSSGCMTLKPASLCYIMHIKIEI